MQRKQINKKFHSLTLYVIFSIIVVVLYSIIEFIFSTVTGISHDTLTTCVYAFFAGEIVTSGLIKIFKLKEKKNDDFLG
jgi:hypothetical protein